LFKHTCGFYVDNNGSNSTVFRYAIKLDCPVVDEIRFTNERWFEFRDLPPLEPNSQTFVNELNFRQRQDGERIDRDPVLPDLKM
jgi:hypothetical protein